MTDFVLRSTDKTAMYAAYAALGVLDDEGNLKTSGQTADGGDWAIYDQGFRTIQTGVGKKSTAYPDGEPVYTTDEYWSIARWNSGEPLPTVPPETTVVWRSDADPQEPYPEGVSVFA